jgi:heptosyltransferase-3
MTQTNIGDVILSTTLLDRLLTTYPDAVVDIVAGGRSLDLFEAMPNLGQLIPIVKKKHHMHYIDLWKKLVKNKYDLTVDLRGTGLSYFLRSKKRIVFNSKDKKTHKAVQMANLWPMDKPLKQRVWVSNSIQEKVDAQIEALGSSLLVGVGPTANWIGKTWPQRYYAILANQLIGIKGFEHTKFVVFGAAHEKKWVEDFLNHLPADRKVDLIGQTSLPEAYAWMTRLEGFLGNDSGLSHLAAAAGIPTLTLFGPTWENLYAPVALKGGTIVAPERDEVNLEPDAPKRLITDIKPEQALEKIIQVIEEVKREKEEKKSA